MTGLYGPSLKARMTDAAILLEKDMAPVEEDEQGRAARLLQHLEEIQDGAGNGRYRMVRVDESRKETEVVDEGVVSLTLRLHLQDCLKVRTLIVQVREMLG